MILDPDIQVSEKDIIRQHIQKRKYEILARHPDYVERLITKYMSDQIANRINKKIIDEIIEQRRSATDPYYRKSSRGNVLG